MQMAFDGLGYQEEDFPVSKMTSETIFSLPMHGYMEDLTIQKIGNILRSALGWPSPEIVDSPKKGKQTSEAEEISRLRRENQRPKMERDI